MASACQPPCASVSSAPRPDLLPRPTPLALGGDATGARGRDDRLHLEYEGDSGKFDEPEDSRDGQVRLGVHCRPVGQSVKQAQRVEAEEEQKGDPRPTMSAANRPGYPQPKPNRETGPDRGRGKLAGYDGVPRVRE